MLIVVLNLSIVCASENKFNQFRNLYVNAPVEKSESLGYKELKLHYALKEYLLVIY